jgi:beta-lactamase superfamily II metal-dependent hydrolase
MYRVGFGDCFLLTFAGDEPDRHVLVDCGSITEGKAQVSAVAADVVAACTPAGGRPRLELVVATHRHRDHVGGFKDPVWKDVEVGEVWMPWTEDPVDPTAARVRNRQSAFALALSDATALAGFDASSDPLADALDDSHAVERATLAMALNALTNEAAMETLHRGFAGAPPRRFLPEADTTCQARALPGLPGVTAHILGPPRDEAAIARMAPPPGEAFLRLRAATRTEGLEKVGAFRASWRLDRAEFQRRRPGSTFSKADQKLVDDRAEESDGALAAAIDRAVNNTSLMLMFEVGEQWLLFPGDAQWGAWDAALSEPRCRELLKRTTFYKVGHHGSENATPRALVETVIGQPFTAFLSTRPVPQWPNVPRQPLLDAMGRKSAKIVRSDASQDLFVDWEVELGA